MAHKHDFAEADTDLYEVLQSASKEELKEFDELLRTKFSCDLPTLPQAWELTAEFQLMGGNSFRNVLRRHGVKYEKIVANVARKVLPRKNRKLLRQAGLVSAKEDVILEYILTQAKSRMTTEEWEETVRRLNEEAAEQGMRSSVTSSVPPAALLAASGVGYLIARLVAVEALKKAGVQTVAKFVGGRAFAVFTGPIGWAIAGIWLAIDIAGPAYSVTVPGVLLVAAMRARRSKMDAVMRLREAADRADEKVREVLNG